VEGVGVGKNGTEIFRVFIMASGTGTDTDTDTDTDIDTDTMLAFNFRSGSTEVVFDLSMPKDTTICDLYRLVAQHMVDNKLCAAKTVEDLLSCDQFVMQGRGSMFSSAPVLVKTDVTATVQSMELWWQTYISIKCLPRPRRRRGDGGGPSKLGKQ
jgi:hypothetical protein